MKTQWVCALCQTPNFPETLVCRRCAHPRPAPDLSRERAAHLHDVLRLWLLNTMAHESPATVATALMYELTSLAAAVSTSEQAAMKLLTDWLDIARLQLQAFGVGQPHP
jgi:hypothetical protein